MGSISQIMEMKMQRLYVEPSLLEAVSNYCWSPSVENIDGTSVFKLGDSPRGLQGEVCEAAKELYNADALELTLLERMIESHVNRLDTEE